MAYGTTTCPFCGLYEFDVDGPLPRTVRYCCPEHPEFIHHYHDGYSHCLHVVDDDEGRIEFELAAMLSEGRIGRDRYEHLLKVSHGKIPLK